MDLSMYIPKDQHRHYYGQLDGKSRRVYRELLRGYLAGRSKIRVHIRDMDALARIHNAICEDVPEICFIKEIRMVSYFLPPRMYVYPDYRFDEAARKGLLEGMEAAAAPVVQRIRSLPEQERIRALHEWLIRTVTYRDPDAPYSHEAAGPLLYGLGVCEGISKAFKYLADRVGVKAALVFGEALGGDGLWSAHAWNMVFLNGQTMQLDVTFDRTLSVGGPIRYDYYLLPGSLWKDHAFGTNA